MKKVISIIVPIYNQEKYISMCIESIAKQYDDRIEIILINDGSTDETQKILINSKEKYPFLNIIHQENKGCSSARNLGLKNSIGEYIWFVDADDFIADNSFLTLLNILNNKDLDLLIFGYDILKKDKYYKSEIPDKNLKKDKLYLKGEFFNSNWNKIYKSKIIKENNFIFLENTHMGEDLVFNYLYMNKVEKMQIIEKNLYICRQGVGVTASCNFNKRLEIFISLDFLINYFKNDLEELKKIKRLYKKYCIKIPYGVINNLYQKYKIPKEINILKLENKIKERKSYFKTEFKALRLFYKLKYKFYFIKKII